MSPQRQVESGHGGLSVSMASASTAGRKRGCVARMVAALSR